MRRQTSALPISTSVHWPRPVRQWPMVAGMLVSLLAWLPSGCSAHRGPHHPRGEIRHIGPMVDQHLAYENQHIAEDLKRMKLPDEKIIAEMTEEERNLLYFKVHDLDGNGKLDGLEMYYSATHHSMSQADHEHEHDVGETENEVDGQLDGDSAQFKLLNANNGENSDDLNFNHVIEILDKFLEVADLNKDGYLHYPEYAAALKLAQINNHPDGQAQHALH